MQDLPEQETDSALVMKVRLTQNGVSQELSIDEAFETIRNTYDPETCDRFITDVGKTQFPERPEVVNLYNKIIDYMLSQVTYLTPKNVLGIGPASTACFHIEELKKDHHGLPVGFDAISASFWAFYKLRDKERTINILEECILEVRKRMESLPSNVKEANFEYSIFNHEKQSQRARWKNLSRQESNFQLIVERYKDEEPPISPITVRWRRGYLGIPLD